MNDVRQEIKIAHISDFHFGKIQSHDLIAALHQDVSKCDLDLIVVTGDHTQRSRRREWLKARRFLKSLKSPLLAVQGNHDIPPYWEPISRLFYSRARFEHYLGDLSSDQFILGGIIFVGVESGDPGKTTGGTVEPNSLLERMQRLLLENSSYKVVVCLHHPLYDYNCNQAPGIVADYEYLVSQLAATGCGMVLHGHLHRSLSAIEETTYGPILHICAGTATSSRSRETLLPKHSYNLISFRQSQVEVEQRGYNPDFRRFESFKTFTSIW